MDARLFFLINHSWTHPALDRLMAAASSFDLWLPFIVGAVVLTAWRGGARARVFLLTLAVTLAVNDGVVSNTLKHTFHRLRPFQAVAGVRQVDLNRRARPKVAALFRPLAVRWSDGADVWATARAGGAAGRSFPSSHVMNNVCAAVILTLFYGRRGAWFFGVAGLVAYSRVYVGSHWPSDVLVSAVLAGAVALWMAALVRLVLRRTGLLARWGLEPPTGDVAGSN